LIIYQGGSWGILCLFYGVKGLDSYFFLVALMMDKNSLHVINEKQTSLTHHQWNENIVGPLKTFYARIDIERQLFMIWIVHVKSLKNK